MDYKTVLFISTGKRIVGSIHYIIESETPLSPSVCVAAKTMLHKLSRLGDNISTFLRKGICFIIN